MISALMLLVAVWSMAAPANENGSRLWLRMEKTNTTATVTGVKCTAMTELQSYWQGCPVVLKRQKGMPADAYTIKSVGGKAVVTAANDAGDNLFAGSSPKNLDEIVISTGLAKALNGSLEVIGKSLFLSYNDVEMILEDGSLKRTYIDTRRTWAPICSTRY